MTAGLALLVRLLTNGAVVVWTDPPGVQVPESLRPLTRRLAATENAAISEALRRAGAFHEQLKATHGGSALPLFVLPDADADMVGTVGHCISCSATLSPGRAWRCLTCLVAVYIVLDDVEALVARMELA